MRTDERKKLHDICYLSKHHTGGHDKHKKQHKKSKEGHSGNSTAGAIANRQHNGLGNQLFQYVFSRLAAESLGEWRGGGGGGGSGSVRLLRRPWHLRLGANGLFLRSQLFLAAQVAFVVCAPHLPLPILCPFLAAVSSAGRDWTTSEIVPSRDECPYEAKGHPPNTEVPPPNTEVSFGSAHPLCYHHHHHYPATSRPTRRMIHTEGPPAPRLRVSLRAEP